MMDIEGQVAVVTGGSSGVGKAIALGLAAGGARVALAGRTCKKLDEVVAAAGPSPGAVLSYCVDLAFDDQIESFSRDVLRVFGHVDILVHSAGVIKLGSMDRALVENLDLQYRINVRAPYLLSQALLVSIKERRGQIVFINSSVGSSARGRVGQYAATKHALKALADSLREEVNPHGVRVLSLFLGRTATPMQAALCQAEGRSYRPESLLQPEDVASVVLLSLNLPRTAEVTEIHIRPLTKPD